MRLFSGDSAAEAWAAGLQGVAAQQNSAVAHVSVSFDCDPEIGPVHNMVDNMLARSHQLSVKQVANTIFPRSLYQASAENPAASLFENWNYARQVNARRSGSSTTYFDRLTHYPARENEFNQIEHQLERLRRERNTDRPFRGIYEMGLTGAADLRLMVPAVDRSLRGFPCLSHLSLTLVSDSIHLMAQYRYQYMVRKALGNYLGLSWLLAFFANELKITAGRITVNAAYAKVDGKGLGGIKRWVDFAKTFSEPSSGVVA